MELFKDIWLNDGFYIWFIEMWQGSYGEYPPLFAGTMGAWWGMHADTSAQYHHQTLSFVARCCPWALYRCDRNSKDRSPTQRTLEVCWSNDATDPSLGRRR